MSSLLSECVAQAGPADPVAVKTPGGHPVRQPDGCDRPLSKLGGVEDRDVAPCLGHAPDGGEEPPVPFDRILAAGHEHGLGEPVASRQCEFAAGAPREVEPDQAVQPGTRTAAPGDGAKSMAQAAAPVINAGNSPAVSSNAHRVIASVPPSGSMVQRTRRASGAGSLIVPSGCGNSGASSGTALRPPRCVRRHPRRSSTWNTKQASGPKPAQGIDALLAPD